MIAKPFRVLAVFALASLVPHARCQAATAPAASAPTAPEPPVGSPASMAKGAQAQHVFDSAPVVIHQETPEYTDEARRERLFGVVQVALTVDEKGIPQNVRVARGIETELDEQAVKAVRRYRFKPALKDGKPVPVELYIAVNFD